MAVRHPSATPAHIASPPTPPTTHQCCRGRVSSQLTDVAGSEPRQGHPQVGHREAGAGPLSLRECRQPRAAGRRNSLSFVWPRCWRSTTDLAGGRCLSWTRERNGDFGTKDDDDFGPRAWTAATASTSAGVHRMALFLRSIACVVMDVLHSCRGAIHRREHQKE